MTGLETQRHRIATQLAEFNAQVPSIDNFADVADASRYLSIPDGWLVGAADVVDSTAAIAAGRYKAVNMIGASVIAAVRNELDIDDLPFVFGGDGAAFVIPCAAKEKAAAALAAVVTWAAEEIRLSLRAALVPIADIRSARVDVCVAHFAVTPELNYAMFTGGGAAWAEAQMKDGRYSLAAAPGGTRPDLTSLSCRWQPIISQRGAIASLLVSRREDAAEETFRVLVRRIVDYIRERETEEGRPVTVDTARFALSPPAISLETRASRGQQPYIVRFFSLGLYYVMVWLLFFTGRKIGEFDPMRYRTETVSNTDFRKFDDGLKLTIDCSRTTYAGLQAMLDTASNDGIADYGLHSQPTALMTCIVPSPLTKDHMHFVDGADGGYATAAAMLKAQRAAHRQRPRVGQG